VARAEPDGYTLLVAYSGYQVTNPTLFKKLQWDPIRDFTPVGLAIKAPHVVVARKDLPVNTLGELVTYAKANPGKLNYGSSGIGSASHLQSEYLTATSGIKMTHIPFKGDAEIMRALAEGSVQMGISTIQGAMTSVTGGRVKALAVTGSKRLNTFPDVPALAESDIKGLDGIDPYTYYGRAGPAGMPPQVVARLNAALNKVNASKEAQAYVREKLHAEPGSGNADAFRKFIETDTAKWRTFSKTVKLTD
jgi:tripartite-type tricarboxylate transporter receptor subunit TctC